MAKIDETAHKKIAAILSDSRVSPAILARMMQDEYKYANESLLQYFVNYIILMANATHIPPYLQDIHNDCKVLYSSLQELGLTGTIGRETLDIREYLAV
jgi:hypothetical protein